MQLAENITSTFVS